MMSSIHFIVVLLSAYVGATVLNPISAAESYETCAFREVPSQSPGKVSAFNYFCKTITHFFTFLAHLHWVINTNFSCIDLTCPYAQCYTITSSKTGACYPRLCGPQYEYDEYQDYDAHYSSGGLICKKVQLKRRVVPRTDYYGQGSQYNNGDYGYCKTVKAYGTLVMPAQRCPYKPVGGGLEEPSFTRPRSTKPKLKTPVFTDSKSQGKGFPVNAPAFTAENAQGI